MRGDYNWEQWRKRYLVHKSIEGQLLLKNKYKFNKISINHVERNLKLKNLTSMKNLVYEFIDFSIFLNKVNFYLCHLNKII